MTSFNHEQTGISPKFHTGSRRVRIFSACPTRARSGQTYLDRIGEVARWSEAHGFQGLLVDAPSGRIDPWLLTETIVERTRKLTPLVSVRPGAMHPHALATTVARFATLHARQVCIYWTTRDDGRGVDGAREGHDVRYEHLVEYATSVRQLLEGGQSTRVGARSGTGAAKTKREPPAELQPEYMVSGVCPAGILAARALHALPVTYARPPEPGHASAGHDGPAALKLGVVARPDRDAAWRAALGRFPPDRGGPLTQSVSRKVSDSHWHLRLCRLAEQRASSGDPYWVGPFNGYKSMCPYLVGSHDDVASALAAYVRRGFHTFLLDESDTEAEIEHARAAFELATGQAVAA